MSPTFDLCWLPHPPRRWSPSNIRSKVQTLPSFPSLSLTLLPPLSLWTSPQTFPLRHLQLCQIAVPPSTNFSPLSQHLRNRQYTTRPTPKSSNPPFRNYQYLSRPFSDTVISPNSRPSTSFSPFPNLLRNHQYIVNTHPAQYQTWRTFNHLPPFRVSLSTINRSIINHSRALYRLPHTRLAPSFIALSLEPCSTIR